MPLIAASPVSGSAPATSTAAASAAAAATAGAAKTGTAKTGAAGALGGMGSDAFMKLLVAQMRYQNPMEPTDSSQYLAQISQYAMVEQLQKVSEGQQEVSSYQRVLIANSMIGRVVAGIGESGLPMTGQVLGVSFQAGKPILVTTGGDLAVDKVDEARLPSGAGPTPAPPAPVLGPSAPAAATPPAASASAASSSDRAASSSTSSANEIN